MQVIVEILWIYRPFLTQHLLDVGPGTFYGLSVYGDSPPLQLHSIGGYKIICMVDHTMSKAQIRHVVL